VDHRALRLSRTNRCVMIWSVAIYASPDAAAFSFFFFNAPSPTEIYTLSLHDALPICLRIFGIILGHHGEVLPLAQPGLDRQNLPDRKSTRLNSSHRTISYAVFCLKKKTTVFPMPVGRTTSVDRSRQARAMFTWYALSS